MRNAIRWICGIAVLLAAFWINYVNLTEAYGSGPPYYSRTTNMDKWSNPIPFLVIVNIVAIGLIVLISRIKSRADFISVDHFFDASAMTELG
jgi:hypothetical protein